MVPPPPPRIANDGLLCPAYPKGGWNSATSYKLNCKNEVHAHLFHLLTAHNYVKLPHMESDHRSIKVYLSTQSGHSFPEPHGLNNYILIYLNTDYWDCTSDLLHTKH